MNVIKKLLNLGVIFNLLIINSMAMESGSFEKFDQDELNIAQALSLPLPQSFLKPLDLNEPTIITRQVYKLVLGGLAKIKRFSPNQTLQNSFEKYITIHKKLQFMDFSGTGAITLPDSWNTLEKISNNLRVFVPKRSYLTIDEYFAKDFEFKTLFVGSGLVQDSLQPYTLDMRFKTPLYLDGHNENCSDLTGDFTFGFIMKDSIKPYHGKFDGVYLDNFPSMLSEEVLSSAYQLINSTGFVVGNIRMQGSDLSISEENSKLLQNVKDNQDIQLFIIQAQLESNLKKIGFKNVVFSNEKKSIRMNSEAHYLFYASGK